MLCALIMAGGKGTRFWPLSTEEKPKQFLSLLGNDTMLQMTYRRVNKFIPKERIFISTGIKYKDIVFEQLKDISQRNIIIEPESRNTSSSICLASLYIKKIFDDCNIVVLPSDHLIKDNDNFINTLRIADEFINNERKAIVTFGIKPSRAEVGYGYIYSDVSDINKFNKVYSFVEKPDYNTALKYLNSGNYYWNSGIFIWNVNLILSLIKKFLNNTYNILSPILELSVHEYEEFLNNNYKFTDKISIDYGIMEKYNNIFMIEGKFGWDDVGSWSSVERYGNKDCNGNIMSSNGILMESSNNIVLTEKRVLLNNVDDLIVVETDDYILVSSKEHAQNIKFARNYI